MDDLQATYDRIAEDWHRDHQVDSWWVEGTDKFISQIPTGGNVLDVGCGSGVKSKYLAESGLRVTGIDFSAGMIGIAQREVPEAHFQVLDMRDVGSLPGEFDGVFVQAALLHIPKKEVSTVLAGLASKLKQGGYLYVAVKGMRPDGVEEEVVKERDYGYEYERFFSYFSEEELRSALESLGLSIVFAETKPSGRTAWVQLIARK
jgi:SAM-dependent methyltransferase